MAIDFLKESLRKAQNKLDEALQNDASLTLSQLLDDDTSSLVWVDGIAVGHEHSLPEIAISAYGDKFVKVDSQGVLWTKTSRRQNETVSVEPNQNSQL
jgi:hypothetical protein